MITKAEWERRQREAQNRPAAQPAQRPAPRPAPVPREIMIVSGYDNDELTLSKCQYQKDVLEDLGDYELQTLMDSDFVINLVGEEVDKSILTNRELDEKFVVVNHDYGTAMTFNPSRNDYDMDLDGGDVFDDYDMKVYRLGKKLKPKIMVVDANS